MEKAPIVYNTTNGKPEVLQTGDIVAEVVSANRSVLSNDYGFILDSNLNFIYYG